MVKLNPLPIKINTDQIMTHTSVSHQLVVDHLHVLQLSLIVVQEHEVVVPAVAVKQRAKLIRLRLRDLLVKFKFNKELLNCLRKPILLKSMKCLKTV